MGPNKFSDPVVPLPPGVACASACVRAPRSPASERVGRLLPARPPHTISERATANPLKALRYQRSHASRLANRLSFGLNSLQIFDVGDELGEIDGALPTLQALLVVQDAETHQPLADWHGFYVGSINRG
jgi:hypothetical protein